jgi:para-nitrobenzyl esterase
MQLFLKLALLKLALAGSVTVVTDDGPIEGKRTAAGFDTFHGVPFAAPPTKDLRWRQPVRPTPWKTARKTVRHGASCPQFDFIRAEHLGNEDCLFLSVYSPPQCTPETPCPVL